MGPSINYITRGGRGGELATTLSNVHTSVKKCYLGDGGKKSQYALRSLRTAPFTLRKALRWTYIARFPHEVLQRRGVGSEYTRST